MFFLVPIVVSIMILKEAFQYANKLLSATAATVLSIAAVVPVCFLAGLLARTTVGQQLVRGLEDSVPSKVPAYEYLKQERVAPTAHSCAGSAAVVLARLCADLCRVGAPSSEEGSEVFATRRGSDSWDCGRRGLLCLLALKGAMLPE